MMQPLNETDPREIDRYAILARLGGGGSSVVYLARSATGEDVALKLLKTDLIGNQAVRDRFDQEGRLLQALESPRIVRVREVAANAERPYIVMDLVQGETLAEVVERGGPMNSPILLGLVEGLCDGLRDLHSAGLAHGDLKPANVIFGRDGAKLVDFGIAVDKESAGTNRSLGTPSWSAPEVLKGSGPTPKSDIFSLGLIIGYAANAASPFGNAPPDGMIYRILNDEPQLGKIPAEVRHLVERCLSKDPSLRPTASELSQLLSGGSTTESASPESTRVVTPDEFLLAGDSGSKSISTTGEAKGPKVSKRTKVGVSLLSLALLASIVGGLVWLRGSDDAGYEAEFEDLLSQVEKMDGKVEDYQTREYNLQRKFFADAPNSSVGLGRYVNTNGKNWLRDHAALWVVVGDELDAEINRLRTAPIGGGKRRTDLLEIREVAVQHYSAWSDHMREMNLVIADWIEPTNEESWNEFVLRRLKNISDRIGSTWSDVCLKMGNAQPSGRDDLSERVRKECED
jgi:serine/threonine protein kinase